MTNERKVPSVQDYISRYGFCNWQIQDLIPRIEKAEKALQSMVDLANERRELLGELSKDFEAVAQECAEALKVLQSELK